MLSDSISARTLVLLFLCNSYIQCRHNIIRCFPASGIIPTRLMCRLICNLPEYNIRIFNPLTSYSWFIGMNCGSQILILHAVEFFAALNNTCISDSTLPRADGYVATRLMCRLICNLPEYNIRIFNPLASYCPCWRICSNKTNVPADLHVLLSTAKNLPPVPTDM